MRRFFDFATLSLLVLVSSGAEAANFDDPTWPCIQRKVPNLSIGQMWSGPIIDPEAEASVNDDGLDNLAASLAVRRTSMEEAEQLIDTFAKAQGEDRNDRLARLFAAVFDRINSERGQLISGIGRYAERQSGLAERIEATSEQMLVLEAKEDKTNDEYDRFEELVDKVDWDTRIFEERQQSLTYVCETPIILERRAFGLARLMMERMD